MVYSPRIFGKFLKRCGFYLIWIGKKNGGEEILPTI
jgi:hypothetical protein